MDELVRLLMARPVVGQLSAKPIPDNLPIYLLEAARWVPYRSGVVSIQAVIVRDADLRQVLTEASGLGEMVSAAPAWLVIATDRWVSWWQSYSRLRRERCLAEAACDVGMAVLAMILAAQTVEVQAIPVWQFSRRAVHKTFGIPRTFPVFCLLALGYAESAQEAVTMPKPITLFTHGELW